LRLRALYAFHATSPSTTTIPIAISTQLQLGMSAPFVVCRGGLPAARNGKRRLGSSLMPIPELLRDLLTAPGPSGYEAAPTAVWRAAASAFAEVSGDPLGSSVARVPGTSNGPSLAVLGHIDEIGLMVTPVDDEGFAAVLPVGGIPPRGVLGPPREPRTARGSRPWG